MANQKVGSKIQEASSFWLGLIAAWWIFKIFCYFFGGALLLSAVFLPGFLTYAVGAIFDIDTLDMFEWLEWRPRAPTRLTRFLRSLLCLTAASAVIYVWGLVVVGFVGFTQDKARVGFHSWYGFRLLVQAMNVEAAAKGQESVGALEFLYYGGFMLLFTIVGAVLIAKKAS
jgi:hypothetical protein